MGQHPYQFRRMSVVPVFLQPGFAICTLMSVWILAPGIFASERLPPNRWTSGELPADEYSELTFSSQKTVRGIGFVVFWGGDGTIDPTLLGGGTREPISALDGIPLPFVLDFTGKKQVTVKLSPVGHGPRQWAVWWVEQTPVENPPPGLGSKPMSFRVPSETSDPVGSAINSEPQLAWNAFKHALIRAGTLAENRDGLNQVLAFWAGDPLGLALCRLTMARLATKDSRTDLARFSFQAALSGQGVPALMRAQGYFEWAEMEMRSGFLGRAHDRFVQALDLWKARGCVLKEVKTRERLGRVHIIAGELDRAEESFSRALALVREKMSKAHLLSLETELAWLSYRRGDYPAALTQMESVIAATHRAGLEEDLPGRYDRLGTLLNYMGSYALSEAAYQRALEGFRKNQNTVFTAITLSNMGELYLNWKRVETAIEVCRKSLDLLAPGQLLEIRATSHWEMARAYRELGDWDEAEEQMVFCLEHLETMRARNSRRRLGAAFFQAAFEFIEDYLDLLWQRHQMEPASGFDDRAFELQERIRARGLVAWLDPSRIPVTVTQGRDESHRQLMGQLDHWILQNRWQDGAVRDVGRTGDDLERLWASPAAQSDSTSQQAPFSLHGWKPAYLNQDSLLVAYILGQKRGYAWFWFRGKLTMRVLPPRAELETLILKFTRALVGESTLTASQRILLGEKLAQVLFPDQLPWNQVKHLWILVDGLLAKTSFSALPVPVNGSNGPEGESLLGQLMSWQFLPSLTYAARPRPPSLVEGRGNRTLLAVVDPVFNKTDPRFSEASAGEMGHSSHGKAASRATGSLHFPRLQGTGQTGALLARLWAEKGRGSVLSGFQAHLDRWLAENPEQFDYLHFGTHGLYLDQWPELSGLLFSLFGENQKPTRGYMAAPDLRVLNLKAELVVLAGCRTAWGATLQGEGTLGLARGFLESGAAQVLAGLWDVEDEATTRWMAFFYEALARGQGSHAEAMRQAQVRMSREARWRAPKYWAGFALSGMPEK